MRPTALQLRFVKRISDLEEDHTTALAEGWLEQIVFLRDLLMLNRMIYGYVWPRKIH